MSGRRSSNPRWLAWGIAVAICSLASAGVGLAPAQSTAASSTTFAVEAPRLGSAVSHSDAVRHRNKGPGPRFVVQPGLEGRNLVFVVKVNPYRTASKHRSAKPDLLRGRIDVSRRGVAIRTVGLDPKTRAKKLIFTTRIKTRVVQHADRIQYQIRLPLAVARSLAATSVRNRTTRVRVVLEHAKDTDRRLPVRQTLELAQSSMKPLPTVRSRAETDRLSSTGSNVILQMNLENITPFTLQVSVQPTQCLSTMAQWTGTMSPGQYVFVDALVLYSGSTNDLTLWQDLSRSAVTALQQAAVSAGQNAINQGAASFSPEGAISNGVTFAEDFVVDFITDALLKHNSCADSPATAVVSGVATGLPLPLWQGPNGGASWAVNSAGQAVQSVSVQTPAQLASTLGALTSVQWNWNGGNVAANGAGASYFSGGLIQTSSKAFTIPGQLGQFVDTTFSYQNNADTTYGPQQESNITLTAIPGIDPNENNAPGVNLTCNAGNWSLLSPWSTYNYDLSNPPNSSASGDLVTSFYYNGVDGSGNSVFGQSIPNIGTTKSGYTGNYQPQVWVDQSTIQSIIQGLGGGTITNWGCSVQAQTQVPSFLNPPDAWPSNSTTSNLGWYSEPMNATAPNP